MPGQPFFGALLRMTWERVRDHLSRAIHDAGFSDLQEAHFPVFTYPVPDGIRPSELARQKRMSRQAMNYLIVQLEELGYIERRAPEDGDRRLIYLSARGKQVVDVILACMRRLHTEWAHDIGDERFNDFVDVLRQLSARAQNEHAKTPGSSQGALPTDDGPP
ncbi:MarR family transcriptional regulator [Methylovirgula sp. 4M-Z18]|nr:MarR family transcriptional regulator [Methylovirgula sp. 4M-Z18]